MLAESWISSIPRSALAISEPFAGSDVAAVKATATKTPDGKHFIATWQSAASKDKKKIEQDTQDTAKKRRQESWERIVEVWQAFHSSKQQCAQVNGVKKWITEGAYADYFVTAVRTGGPGGKGQVLSG